MGMIRASVLAVVFCLTAASADAGVILNTLQSDRGEAPGWSGKFAGYLSASGGNTEHVGLAGSGRVMWRGDRDVWRLQTALRRDETNGLESARSVVGHLRQNHRLGGSTHSITFVQIQHNPFQRLSSRWLIGAGMRVDLRADDAGSVAVGATHMIEVERIRGVADRETDQRLSAFLHVSRNVREGVDLDTVVFVQPLWSDLSDRRAMASTTLEILLTGSLTLQVSAGVDYDSRPPTDVETTDWRTVTGLVVQF